jgi:hypothetical protein
MTVAEITKLRLKDFFNEYGLNKSELDIILTGNSTFTKKQTLFSSKRIAGQRSRIVQAADDEFVVLVNSNSVWHEVKTYKTFEEAVNSLKNMK